MSNQSNKSEPLDMEVLQPSALESMERASIDTQVSTAHRFPRSLEQFKKRALSMATLDEETAESCIFRRPVGKKQVNGKWVESYAEGASIRMAEIVAASYGNIRVASRIIEQTDRYVKCEGVAHDLESNYAAKSEAMESTVKSDGTPYSEGMRTVVAKATLAKAFRDAIFKVVPRAMCKTIYDAAIKVTTGADKPIEERRKRAAAWIASLKIPEKNIFAGLGVNGWSEINDEQLLTLTGLKTAITDGETTVADAFPNPAKTAEPTAFTQAQKPETKPKKEEPKKPEPQPSVEPEPLPRPEEAPGDAIAALAEEADASQPASVFKPRPSESVNLTAVRKLLFEANKPEEEFIKFGLDKKFIKEGQKLADLSEVKLERIASSWKELLKQMG